MVHTFSLLGQHIAVDVNSGAVHILDEITYHVLRQMEEAATPLDKIIAADNTARRVFPKAMESCRNWLPKGSCLRQRTMSTRRWP